MKNLIPIAFTVLMVIGVSSVGNTPVFKEGLEESEEKAIVDTEEIHILTDEELSLLYTCKPEERKQDDSIVEYSYEEAQMIMKLAKAEHGNEDALAQAYVMATINNRVKSDGFPNTVEEVIFQKDPIQFTTTINGKYEEAIPDSNSHLALAMIEKGEVSHDAFYFEADWMENSWQSQNRDYAFEYKGTRYYK